MMKYFWYILTSVLAGVGTGLVGLSAATVMVAHFDRAVSLLCRVRRGRDTLVNFHAAIWN